MDGAGFAAAMDALRLPFREFRGGLALGVSGGADSTALAALAAGWAAPRGVPLLALACDHGLRPESAAEAAGAAETMRGMGVPCLVLRLAVAPGPGLQERARDARYAAMLDAMRRRGVGVLAVGHHRSDQAETVEHRLSRGGSSPAALAGMAPVRVAGDALMARPLLGAAPGDLRALLRERGVPWAEDPSNSDPKYARSRIRAALRADPLREAGLLRISADAAAALALIRADARERLEASGAAAHPGGASSLEAGALGTGPAAAEALRQLLARASGRHPAAPDAALTRLLAAGTGTLAGAAAWRSGGRTWIAREARGSAPPAPASPWMLWDGRLRLAGDVPAGAEAGQLGEADAGGIRGTGGSSMPRRALAAVPCLRVGGVLASVPELSLGRPVEIGVALRRMPEDEPSRMPPPGRVPGA